MPAAPATTPVDGSASRCSPGAKDAGGAAVAHRLHARDQLILVVCAAHAKPQNRVQAGGERRGERHRDAGEPDQLARVQTDRAGDGARTQQRHGHGVHRGDERTESCVDDAGRDEQLEGVTRDPEHVEQERDRGIDVAEHDEQAGAHQLQVASPAAPPF